MKTWGKKMNIFSWRNFKMKCQGSVLKGERLWAILALREDDKKFQIKVLDFQTLLSLVWSDDLSVD